MTEESQKKSLMQGQDWSGEMGEKWNRYRHQFESMIAPIGQAAIALAAFQPGERVIDIGCGAGPTTLEIARQVAPGGEATGLDLSPVLVATASARAADAKLGNARFICGDAGTLQPEPGGFDVLFSRFGVMFFSEPGKAFVNLHDMLSPGARLVFCCWGPPPETPWVGKLSAIVGSHITMPPPDPTAPGPFAFADQARTTAILEQAGFSKVVFTPWRGGQLLGGPGMDIEAAADFAMKAFFVGEALTGQPEPVVAAVMADIKAMFAQHQTPEGIELAAMAWLVTATA